jgi:hypothetical protein
VYHALPTGPGVLYTVTEQVVGLDGQHVREVDERWRTAEPARERAVIWSWRNYGREHFWHGESAIPAGGTWSTWSTFRPHAIERTKSKGILAATAAGLNPSEIRSAYESGHLRLLGKGTFEGKPVYRLRMPCPTCRNGHRWIALMVDARTFLPIYVEYARERDGRRVARFVLRYLVYKELPLTPANLSLLNMRPHPGAHVLERR